MDDKTTGKSDALDKYKKSETEYFWFLHRLEHITAVLVGMPPYDLVIRIYDTSISYSHETGYVSLIGEMVSGTGPGVELNMKFPLELVDRATDEELLKWRDTTVGKTTEKEKTETDEYEKPLSTYDSLTKRKLIDYLKKADIADNAEMTLKFDRDTGKFYIFFYWSEGPGAFGHRTVNFDIESEDLCGDAWNWMERD